MLFVDLEGLQLKLLSFLSFSVVYLFFIVFSQKNLFFLNNNVNNAGL